MMTSLLKYKLLTILFSLSNVYDTIIRRFPITNASESVESVLCKENIMYQL